MARCAGVIFLFRSICLLRCVHRRLHITLLFFGASLFSLSACKALRDVCVSLVRVLCGRSVSTCVVECARRVVVGSSVVSSVVSFCLFLGRVV